MPPTIKTVKKPKDSPRLPTRTITQSVLIAATPVEVYDAIVNAKKHAAFTGSAARSSNKIGGKFMAWDGYITGKFLQLTPGRKIVEEWRTRDWPEDYPPSIVELRFEREAGATRLTMTQSQVPAIQTPEYRQGWKDYYWKPLKEYFRAKDSAAKPSRSASRVLRNTDL